MMFAAGMLLDKVRFKGNTASVDGAIPKLHCNIAPLTTWIAMARYQPPVAWISTRRFSAASGSSVLSNWLSPLPIAFSRAAATPLFIR